MAPEYELENITKRGLVLKGPLTRAQVELENMVSITDKWRTVTVPFGRINKDWKELMRIVRPGDHIYFISSSAEHWQAPLSGAFTGYGVFRNGCIIEFLRISIS